MPRRCTGCGHVKSESCFSRRRDRGPDGRVSRCKECVSLANTNRSKEEKKKASERTAKWRKENPDKAKMSAKRSNIKARNQISKEQYDAFFAVQEGCCALCDQPSKQLTAFGAGLLCRSCHEGILRLNADHELIQRASDYVKWVTDGTR